MKNIRTAICMFSVLIFFAVSAFAPADSRPEAPENEQQVGHGYFIQNAGQFSGGEFLLRSALADIWVSADDIRISRTYAVHQDDGKTESMQETFVLAFEGSSAKAILEPFGRVDTVLSYLIGSDPVGWQVEVPVWSGLRIRGLYRGIDLVIYGEAPDGGLDWTWEAQPGADLSAVNLVALGVPSAAAAGELQLFGVLGTLSLGLPRESSMAVTTASTTESTLAALDGVVTDSLLDSGAALQEVRLINYLSFLGGSGLDKAYSVSAEGGFAYVTGYTQSADFPLTGGVVDTTLAAKDAFVAKVNGNGTGLVYATFLGGENDDIANDIAVAEGIAYITGKTNSTSFPGLASWENRDYEVFVVSLNAAGTGIRYARRFGGSADVEPDEAFGIAVEGGNAYFAGLTYSADLNGTSTLAKGDIFAVKLDSAGNTQYTAIQGGGSLDAAYDIAVSGGIAYLTGTSDSKFFMGAFPAGYESFVLKLNAVGALEWKVILSGSGTDLGNGIALDSLGNIYVAGTSDSANFISALTANLPYGGADDGFIVRLTSAGTPNFQTFLGGAADDRAFALAVDGLGGVQVTGETASTNFPVTADAFHGISGGTIDAFVARIVPGATPLLDFSTYLGGLNADAGRGLALDINGSTVISGETSSSDFPLSSTPFDATYGGAGDGYVGKLAIGPIPGVVLEKSTNGADADLPPGPYILKNGSVTWRYQIYNTGSATLNSISLTDNLQGSISCPTTSLAPGASTTCTASGTAIAGQYENKGTVVAQPPGGLPTVTDDDLSHYFGADPKITITATTAGLDGRVILVGQTAAITYLVNNTGNVPLGNVNVTDNSGISVTCPGNTLAASEQFTCNASMPVTAGLITHTATVTASPPGGLPGINASDPTSHFGASPSIALTNKVSVNGGTTWNDSNTAPGPTLLIGNAPKFQLSVMNNGNVALTNIAVPGCSTIASLAVGATSSACMVTGTWAAGQQENLKTATGTFTDGLGNAAPLSSADPAYYFGADPKLSINKEISLDSGATWLVTNTGDAPTLLAGFDTPRYRITVKNTGNVALNTTISDSVMTLGTSCTPVTLGPDDHLAGGPDEKICIVEKAWGSGLRTNTATAAASFTDDGSHNLALNVTYSAKYFGAAPAVSIEKYVSVSNTTPSWQMADSAPGPYLLDGHAVPQYKVTITNSGNVPLTGINVTDSDFSLTGCTAPFNLVSGSKDCTATAGWAAGQQENTASLDVSYQDSAGHIQNIQLNDKAYYYGAQPGLTLTVDISVNGGSSWYAADSAPGPELVVGSVAPKYRITVTNTGNVSLAVTLTDPLLTLPPGCAPGTLPPGSVNECVVTGSWAIGPQTNTATASAAYPDSAGNSANQSVNNSAHYFGAQPLLDLEKYVSGDNGGTWQDADTQPGPYFLSSSVLKYKLVLDNTGNVNLSTPTWSDPGFILTGCPLPASFTPEAAPVECTLSGTWAAGQVDNLASASASYTDTAGHLAAPSDTDAAHYFGALPGVSITKNTNGVDANSAPGPYILAGDTVTWTYVITNTGNVPLTGIGVSDDNGTPLNSTDDFNVSCPTSNLATGLNQTCQVNSTAIEGQYANVGKVIAQPQGGIANIGNPITTSDASHYFGARVSLTLEKTTNGVATDNTPPGPFVQIGQPVDWAFKVTNTSNIPLTNIEVRDDFGTPSNSADDLVVCTISSLGAGKSNNPNTCRFSRTALAGQYVNVGTATVNVLGKVYTATDKGHYYGYDPNQVLDLTVSLNGQVSTNPPGVYILTGNNITFLYTIYNSSSSEMQIIGLTDDNGTPSNAADDVTICQGFAIPSSSTHTCSRTIPAVEGPPTHIGTVAGTIATDVITHSASSSYFGVRPGITLNVHTNGQDPSSAQDLPIKAGDPVTWEYFIENTSNVDLSGISLVDEQVNPIACPFTELAIGASMTCTAEGVAQSGANQIPFHVKGVWPDDLQEFFADADTLYFGVVAGVTLDFQVNGQPADAPPGPEIVAGSTVDFTYTITNSGNFLLQEIIVVDDASNLITCPAGSLGAGQSKVCGAQEIAQLGLQPRTATVTGLVFGESVNDTDLVYYTGVQEKFNVYLPLIMR